MFSWQKWTIIHPLFVQNYIQRSIAFHSSLASQSTAHKIKYSTKDVYGENKSYHRSTEVEGFEELNLSYTIISLYIPSTINNPKSLSASVSFLHLGIFSAALQQVPTATEICSLSRRALTWPFTEVTCPCYYIHEVQGHDWEWTTGGCSMHLK